jgi:hypothetical protein
MDNFDEIYSFITKTMYEFSILGNCEDDEDELEPEENENFWSTYDLGISSALISRGYELAHMNKDNPKRVKFFFRKTAGMENLVELYFRNKLKVKAREYFENVKAIKNRLYSDDSPITKN